MKQPSISEASPAGPRYELTALGRTALENEILAEQSAAKARVVAEGNPFAGAKIVESGLVPGCTHADADLVDSHGNWPTDTVTVRYRCWHCCASFEIEYLPTDPAVNRPEVARMLRAGDD
jgi:hypothetical protein